MKPVYEVWARPLFFPFIEIIVFVTDSTDELRRWWGGPGPKFWTGRTVRREHIPQLPVARLLTA